MRIDLERMQDDFRIAQSGKRSRHSPADRTEPSLFQYDYLLLNALSRDIARLLKLVPDRPARALDLGSDKCPYRSWLEAKGFEVRTIDISPGSGADYSGTVEATGLPDDSFDLVLCTQVLEHCDNPWQGVREIRRILSPGGHAVLSVPHVWFYHPHPKDHWRFTQEGLIRLCRDGGLEPLVMYGQGGSLLCAAQVLNFLAYGLLGRGGAPLYAVVNALGALADRLVPNTLFCSNFACLVQKAREG